MRRVYTWVAFVLAVWLPLQAVAVPLLAGCCPKAGAAAAAADAPCHEHAAMGGAVVDDPSAPDPAATANNHDGGPVDNPSHVCCPHYAGAPVHRFDVAAEPTRFAPPVLILTARSHVPEQPQRPPEPRRPVRRLIGVAPARDLVGHVRPLLGPMSSHTGWFMFRLIAFAAAGAALATYAPFGAAHDAAQGKSASVHVETAFGRSGDPRRITRTIDVDMSDTMRFTPSRLAVRRGDTVRFRVRNAGKVMHEFVLGTQDDLKSHAELMRKHPGMEHDEPFMTHVAPGRTGEVIWQFTRAGEFHFGCLVAGHFEAGMQGRIVVNDIKENTR